MTSPDEPRTDEEMEPEEGWFIDESITDAPLEAREEARFAKPARSRFAARSIFYGLLLLAFLMHGIFLSAFLYRDWREPIQMAMEQETPVEIVVEKPPESPKAPEPPKPEPRKPPEPPKPPPPKEDLSPALSAPRAPNEDKTNTETKEAKTAAPTRQDEPTKGEPKQAPPASAPPKEASPDEAKKEEAAKEAKEEDKREAEALDKARKAAAKAKEAKTKAAKAAQKRKAPNALAALAGAPQLDATMSFAKPTPKTKIYGGTEDVRWMSIVEAALEAKVQKLPQTAHWRDGGHVVVFFHVDVSGRVIAKEIVVKSGYPDIDAIAMRALASAAPFPPPPPGLERGLYWASTFDGVLPKLTISKR